MQSSVGLAFRALVMLGCLALVPFLALYGKQIPDFYHAVVDAYNARMKQKPADPLASLGSDAPAWAPTNDHRATDPAWRGSATQSNLQQTNQPYAAPNTWNNGAPAAPMRDVATASVPAAGAVQPASYAVPVDPGKTAGPVATASREPGASLGPQNEGGADTCTVQFRHVEQRLRELGSTYYFLETWGAAGDRYRFYCQVALTGNTDSGHSRVFQATDADPLSAMKSVLDQVERFRAPGPSFSTAPAETQR